MVQSKKPKKAKDLPAKKVEPKKADQVKGGVKRRTRGGDDDLDDLEVERLR
jgi:hypothetical protein